MSGSRFELPSGLSSFGWSGRKALAMVTGIFIFVGAPFAALSCSSSETTRVDNAATTTSEDTSPRSREKNDDGPLGAGDNNEGRSSEQVGAETNWASIAAGGSQTVAIKTDGTLWTWGVNDEGQLGDDDDT